MAKIITLGEIMLRLSTENHKRLTQANQLDISFGGGEANVTISLANYGHHACFVTKLPTNALGDSCMHFLSSRSVDTKNIVRGGKRIGLYFLETGVSIRPSSVLYDRQYSSFSEASLDDFDWESIFQDADWFHITGITPALGKNGVMITEYALKKARALGITTSLDLNYRSKLWTPEQAQKVMVPLMAYVDVCIGNEEDATHVLGMKLNRSNAMQAEINIDDYQMMLKRMMDQFHFKYVATSLRTSFSATKNDWQGLLYDGKAFYLSKKYTLDPILDRVGAGDAFAAGLIHGLLHKDANDAIEFAVAASALKHTIFGDSNDVTEVEVRNLMKGNQSGRVQR